MDLQPILIASIPGLLALAAVVLQWWRERGKDAAQIEDMEFNVTQKVLRVANEELDRQHKEVDRLNKRVTELAVLLDGVESELETERRARLALAVELEIERTARKEAEARVERRDAIIKKLVEQLERAGIVIDIESSTGPLAPLEKP